MLTRYTAQIISAILPLLLFGWFVPNPVGQIDFWLLWVVAMLFIGLPVVFAEVGLARRSGQMPLSGIQSLTREADSSQFWRGFAWLSVLMAIVLAATCIQAVSTGLLPQAEQLGIHLDVPVFALAIVLVVLAAILSLLGSSLLIAGGVLLIAALLLGMTNMPALAFAMTDTNLGEWARAVSLALVSVGAGTGLFWFAQSREVVQKSNQDIAADTAKRDAQQQHNSSEQGATKLVLQIWLTQMVAGVVAMLLSSQSLSPLAGSIYALGVLCAAGFFIYYATLQLANKFGYWVALAVTVVLTIGLVLVSSVQSILILLVLISLVAVVMLAIFSGWQMKISHMRKSLNFSSEATYNLWRVAIRLIVPLLVALALVGWLLQWLK